MSTSGTLRYQFDCSNNVTPATISTYLPITNISSSITIGTIVVTKSINTYTVEIPYSYTTINTTSGVHFNASTTVFNYYNNTSATSKVSNLKILDLNNIPLSSSGNQFQNLTTLIQFTSGQQSSATILSGMFTGCTNLASATFDASFNTSNVTAMNAMFNNCSSLTSISFGSNFNTSNVTTMINMFQGCSKLTSLNISNFNTSNVTTMSQMFYACIKLQSLNLSNWNTKKVTTMATMFKDDASLNSITFGGNFDASACTTMASMFYGCSSLTAVDLSNCTTPNVTTMNDMFTNCSSLTSVNISNFNTTNVTAMGYMFNGCSKLQSLNLSNWNTKKVTTMASMFQNDASLNSITFGGNFDASLCTNMSNMFNSCSSLTTIDLSNCTTANVTNMTSMFQGCSNLSSLNISKFTTTKVTKMNAMFNGCINMTSLSLANWNTTIVTNMTSMFQDTPLLTTIGDVYTNWNVTNVGTNHSQFALNSGLTRMPTFVDSPTITSNATASVYENSSTSTTVYTVTAIDVDTNTTFTYSISGGADALLFTIDASNGYVTFIASPNFEAPADGNQDNVYDIVVRVSDGANFVTKSVAITVLNANETPVITSAGTASVYENSSTSTAVYTVTATDVDANTTFIYSISGDDASLCSINSSTGVVTFNTQPNFEAPIDSDADNIYNIVVRASDGELYAEKSVAITVTNVNETPSITNSTTTSQVTTAVGTSTAVYTVTSTDVDENNILTYSISGGADASLCNIGSSTGAVTFKANPTVGIYYITVKVTDQHNANDEKAITIIVTSETASNHSALTDATVATITENSVVVGNVAVTDLSTSVSVEVPNGSTLTVDVGTYPGILSGNGIVVVTGTVDLTTANLEDYSGTFTVSGIVTIAATAGTMITLISNNDGSTAVAVKISSADTNNSTTIATDLYASSDATIENTNTEQRVVLTGTLYKPSTSPTLVGLIQIVGSILGQTLDSTVSLADSDINIGNATGSTANVEYASTDQDAYVYDGATTVYNGSTLTLNNGANLEKSVVTINTGATLILNYIDTPIQLKGLILNGNLIINVNSTSIDIGSYDILNTTNASTINNSHVVINDTTSYYAFGYSNTTNTEYKIAFSTPSSNVCFPAKTPVMTNQGPVNIEDIDPAVHTIRNKKIVAITKTVAHDKNLVRIAKHALGHLYPEKTTTMSQNHKVFFQGQMVKAKHLVNEDKGITLVPYKGEILYNVLLEQHEKMQVNNLIVETLHPEHKVAKLYRFLKNVDAAHHGKLIELFNKRDRAQRNHNHL